MQPRMWLIALLAVTALFTAGCLGGAGASATVAPPSGAPPWSGSTFPDVDAGTFPTNPEQTPSQIDQTERVPEPASVLLVGLGFVGLPLLRRRKSAVRIGLRP